MDLLQETSIDWNMLLLGEEDWSFLLEVLLRSAIMFLVTVVALRVIGKRGIMQGVFEIVTIITLGSAAGDPMFYKKVGVLPGMMVFVAVVLMYRIINFFITKYKPLEYLIEGKHVRLIKEHRFDIDNFKRKELSKDEIFSDLRMTGVSHLGQVDAAYIEASGEISVFFYRMSR
ncbi:MAG: YetF domain-containing protein [Bacteroidota bacterium]